MGKLSVSVAPAGYSLTSSHDSHRDNNCRVIGTADSAHAQAQGGGVCFGFSSICHNSPSIYASHVVFASVRRVANKQRDIQVRMHALRSRCCQF